MWYAAAVKCPALVFRVVSTADSVPGTVVNVSCPAGQKLTNGHNLLTAFCSIVGKWIPEIPGCVGESCINECCRVADFRDRPTCDTISSL